MSKELFKPFLKLSTFAAATFLSLVITSAVLRNPLSRGLVSLLLVGALLVAVLYGIAKYLAFLWRVSDGASTLVLGRVSKQTTQGAAEPVEQAR